MTRHLLDTNTLIDVSKGWEPVRSRVRALFANQTVLTSDALIAATAWYWSAIVVTGNVKDFPMTDVKVVSFRS